RERARGAGRHRGRGRRLRGRRDRLLGADPPPDPERGRCVRRARRHRGALAGAGWRAGGVRRPFRSRRGPPPAPAGVPGGFDAIFVPDGYRAVGLIAPALAFAGVRGVRLLGTSGWNDPGLLRVGREHVEGAVFTGAVVREGRSPILAEFSERFRGGFGRPPDALAGMGFDAALLVLRGMLDGGATRDGLRAGLRAGPLDGVSGTTDFSAGGNAERRPHLLGVEAGGIMDPAH